MMLASNNNNSGVYFGNYYPDLKKNKIAYGFKASTFNTDTQISQNY